MRVLVFGGSGFLGTSVVPQLLESGHQVTVFHRGITPAPPGCHEIIGDRHDLDCQRSGLRGVSPQVVVDLIAASGRQAAACMRVFRGVADRILVASSIDVYRAFRILHNVETGDVERTPLTEESSLSTAQQTYPAAQLERLMSVFHWLDERYDKVAVERTVANDPELPSTVLRLPMLYGPGDHLHRLRSLLTPMDDGRRAVLLTERLAGWRAARGYVENVAAAIVLAVNRPEAAGRTYNVADCNCSEMEWAESIAQEANWNGRLVVVPDALTPLHLRVGGNLAQHLDVDSSLIRRELGYRPRVTQAEALRRTIEWERRTPVLAQDFDSFDYDAEDKALAAIEAKRVARPRTADARFATRGSTSRG